MIISRSSKESLFATEVGQEEDDILSVLSITQLVEDNLHGVSNLKERYFQMRGHAVPVEIFPSCEEWST
jgi:hypothetical protein